MFRFFVNKKQGSFFQLSKDTLNHIKVARVANENFICVFEGKFYICKLEGEMAKILEEMNLNHEFKNDLVIAAAVIDFKKMDFLIQKAAELGAKRFIPMITKNVSQKIYGDPKKRLERWNKIALNACEQSFRNKLMIVDDITTFDDVLKIPMENKYIAHEKDDSSVDASYPTNSIFLIGPEGGFADSEIEKAKANQYKIISLGKRILRAETASLFVLSKVVE